MASFDSVRVDSGVRVTLRVVPGATGDTELAVTSDPGLRDVLITTVEAGRLNVTVDGPPGGTDASRPFEVSADVGSIESVSAQDGATITLSGSVAELEATALGGAVVDADQLEVVKVDVDNGATMSVCATGMVTGSVTNGSSLNVVCGGDVTGVATANAGTVSVGS